MCKYGHDAGRHPSGTCKECQRIWQRAYKKRTRRLDPGARAKTMYSTAKNNARVRVIEFALTPEAVYGKLVEALARGLVTMEMNSPTSASIDRHDSSIGYTDDNIQIVPCWFNLACSDWDKDLVVGAIEAWQHQKERLS